MSGTRVWCAALLAGAIAAAAPAAAQESPPVGREAALALEFEPLEFDPPEAARHELPSGVAVFHLRDPSLPLVTVTARFEGGLAHFPRELHAAATSVSGLLRAGGTAKLTPDSVDALIDLYALETTFGSGGRASFASVNTLTSHLGPALELWGDMLREPGFDSAEVEVRRGRALEAARRREDNPTLLAFSEFNRLMYGDHPVGWEMRADELEPEDLSREKLEHVHRRIYCPGNLVLGVTGDVSWDEIRPRLEALLDGWPPCPEPLPAPPEARIREGAGVFLIPRPVAQSTVIMAHAHHVRRADDPDYFASRVANEILGGGGFTSRIVSRVRTERGLAYSATSLWTAPPEDDGLVGAVTSTRADGTVAATRTILEVMEEMRREPPDEAEVETVVRSLLNGWAFNFQSAGQIVVRRMDYEARGLPSTWLDRYLDGIRAVGPDDVLRVMRAHVHPDRMVILILGDPEAMDEDPAVLGEVRIREVEEPPEPGPAGSASEPRDDGEATTPSPRGSPRSPG